MTSFLFNMERPESLDSSQTGADLAHWKIWSRHYVYTKPPGKPQQRPHLELAKVNSTSTEL